MPPALDREVAPELSDTVRVEELRRRGLLVHSLAHGVRHHRERPDVIAFGVANRAGGQELRRLPGERRDGRVGRTAIRSVTGDADLREMLSVLGLGEIEPLGGVGDVATNPEEKAATYRWYNLPFPSNKSGQSQICEIGKV